MTTPTGPAVAVVVVRDGRVPAGADEAVAEANGKAVVVGTSPEKAFDGLTSATHIWWADTGVGTAGLSRTLAPVVTGVTLVILPASPDGRDLAPRLAATLGRPLLAAAARAWVTVSDDGTERTGADVLRADSRVSVRIEFDGSSVATLLPGVRSPAPSGGQPTVVALEPPGPPPASVDVEVLGMVEPDPATMDLADATRILAGGAGWSRLVPPMRRPRLSSACWLMWLPPSGPAGATRVATDAGWIGYDRQIGTTGVAVDPGLYVAFGISGAAQHVGGLGAPHSTVSINTDPSCPMTSMADLGLVVDAAALLLELARRLGTPIPDELEGVTT